MSAAGTDAAGRGWSLPERATAKLRLALGYPYEAPPTSFVFRDGEVHPFDATALDGRMPVLAHGSNRAPAQLARKFAGFRGAASTIPVTYVWLDDHDVVYSAHVTTYGAIASTLQHVPGCRARVALTWLDDAQLARMHETEGNYRFGVLDGVRVTPEAGDVDLARRIGMYLSDHGHLADAGAPVGLAAVLARPRPHPSRTQGQVLEHVRRRLAPGTGFERFVLACVNDAGFRREIIAGLHRDAGPTRVPAFAPC